MVEPDAVQVRVFWGDALLRIEELSPPRSFYVGDGAVSAEPVDFTVPEMESARAALLTTDGGRVIVHAPDGAELSLPDEPAALPEITFAPRTDPTPPRASVRLGALRFEFVLGTREAPCPRSFDSDEGVRPLAFFAASSLLVGTFAALMAYFTPQLGLTDDEDPDRDQLILMNVFLDRAAEREREVEHEEGRDSGGSVNAPAQPARGESGRIGHPSPTLRSARGSGSEQGAVERPAMSREAAVRNAAQFGMVGLLNSGAMSANLAAWDDAGVGTVAREGGFFGNDIEASGTGGLALTGIGLGGGGPSNQIGLGRIGTCEGADCEGTGRGVGRTGGTHAPHGPTLRMAGTTVLNGSLPPDVIQRIVRQSFGRFRGCYEEGLRTNPTLEGRVTARFVIARDGSVATVQSGGSDLPDARVVACVLHTYSSLSFPPPKEGIVTVTYPLSFTPTA
ncbi:MAG TPA: AgmX/PglI C-terminal domain-containing protein [Polyangiaceae bacterium]|nr:AgmX/PglI C-terminal domain-containing protein [Polyangiaceae bacterium]